MQARTTEELIIFRIELGIKAIRKGTKTVEEANLGSYFNRLKVINIGWYETLFEQYKQVLASRNKSRATN